MDCVDDSGLVDGNTCGWGLMLLLVFIVLIPLCKDVGLAGLMLLLLLLTVSFGEVGDRIGDAICLPVISCKDVGLAGLLTVCRCCWLLLLIGSVGLFCVSAIFVFLFHFFVGF